ncbi:uncharacterized protein K452DRAFT_290378 [Aplosporella prunicola CBS 121167]|uniref:Uncharacterized protein n=1 Tax=Aplosporella prunicola CBS 121167 TaxID=1176127 RepID=A0A6A6B4G1_9PEZI|nr:uncharacterized protein K452DRAFT_290378 [Aplosporella prunicola CBS 121167]KAF2138726.1 hypothetical protein K452DRAFT_290378 [Aplosporella prunicola CBS 121167]
MSVNVPVNLQQKEKDVNTKLQLYGIFSAFSNGKVPSNKQIDVALNSALVSRALSSPSKKLSPEGQKLVGDVKEVIEAAKILLLTKNEGNLLQDFIWQTQLTGADNTSTPRASIGRDEARQHGNEALDGLRTLGTLILSNGQFRKLLSDATVLLRDIAGDAATKTANRVNPTEEQLNQIDDPAADDTWHDVPSKGDLKEQARGKFHENKPFGRDEAKNALGDAAQEAHPTGSRDPTDVADTAARDQRYGGASGVDAQSGARAGVDTLKQHTRENVPDETQDRLRERRERTTNYLKSKMPQERREQTIWRLKKMVVEIQGHQDYMRAIETLLRLAEEYTGHSRDLVGQTNETVKGAHTDDSLQMAEADLKTLIERFANGTSLDDVFDSIKAVYRDADKDPQLKGWFRHLNAYIRRCLKEQGYVMQDQATEEWNQLYDEGHFLLRDRYRNHTDRVLDEFKFIGQQFDEDPQNKAFSEALQKLFLDLGQDENGQAAFKPHLLKDLTEVIVPAIFENIRYVPIPRIEYSDPTMDAVVENLVVEGDNLAPNVLECASDNHWRWGRKKITSKNKNKVMLSVSGVQMDLRDVSYYVNRKQGFPSIKDQGICDVFMGGDGFSFKVAAETADKTDRQHFFKVNKVDVDVKNLKLKMKKSNHKLLFNLAKPMLIKVIRPALQKALEQQIRNNFNQIDALLFAVNQEAESAKAEMKKNPDPQNVQNIYQRYASAAQKQLMKANQKKERAKEAVADKKVNMAVTQNDSMFQNISLPGGISTKATEYQELARKGDKWESPIFSIGSAKETSNLPRVPRVTRKPHNVNTGGVRGGNHPNADEPYSQGNDTGNFSNQVNQAFDGTNDYHKGGLNGYSGVGTGYQQNNLGQQTQVGPGAGYNGTGAGNHTVLGANNPVYKGLV